MPQPSTIDRARLLEALELCAGNRRQAGNLLGISRATLYRWMDRHAVHPDCMKLIGGRYVVAGLLGRGGQGTVFRVRDQLSRLGEKALKLLHAPARDGCAPEEAVREYRTLSLLRHPSLIRVHDFGIDEAAGNRPFVVMDLLGGSPFLEAARGRSISWVATALSRALEAVDHLHRHGLLHRDLKSENVIVEPGESSFAPARVTVTDLGLAAQLDAPDEAGPRGSLSYLAPEVLLGEEAAPASDLYSLGVTVYLALSGGRLDKKDAPGRMAGRGVRRELAPLSSFRDDVPPGFARVVDRLLADDPAERYREAGAAIDDLAPFTSSHRGRLVAEGAESEFVGREAEQDEIVAHLLASEAADAAPLVLVEAPAGMGKTRLLAACAAEVRARGMIAVEGAGERDGDTSLAPLPAMIDQLLAMLAPGNAEQIDALRDRYRHALGSRDASDETARGLSRFHVIDGLVALLCELARVQPLVLVLDDLHLADPLLLDLLWHLARRAAGGALRILAGTRPLQGDPTRRRWLDGIQAEDLLSRRELGQLDAGAVRALAEARLGGAHASYLAEHLLTISSGHPLFLQQLLQEVAERTAGGEDFSQRGLPRTIEEAIAARFDRLGEKERELLAAVAVAGRDVEENELGAVLGVLSPAILARTLGDGMLARRDDGRVGFSHPLLRETVLDNLEQEGRRDWHRRWAELLSSAQGDAVQRAGHRLAAEEGESAREDLLQAAELLFGRWQYAASARYFGAALARFEIGDPRRLKIHPRHARALREAHDHERLEDACRAWAADAEALGRPGAEAVALSHLAICHRQQDRWDDARQEAERAVALAEEAAEAGPEALAQKILATILLETWRHEQALPHFERAVELAEKADDPRALANNLHDIALPLALAGRPAAAQAATDRARQIYVEIGDPVWALLVRTNESLVLTLLGDLERAAELTREMIEEISAERGGVPLELALENLLFLLNRLGRYEEALETGQRLVDHAAAHGRPEQRLSALLGIGEALYQLGERDAARDHHRLALRLAETFGIRRQRLFALLAQARDQRGAGRAAEAARLAGEVLAGGVEDKDRRQVALARLELARIALEAGDAARAERQLDEAQTALRVESEDGPALRAALLLERARAAEQRGLPALALALADEGVGLSSGHGPREAQIDLLALRAQLLRQLDRSDEALPAARRARAAAQQVMRRIRDPRLRALYAARPSRARLLGDERGPDAPDTGDGNAGRTLAELYALCEHLARGEDSERFFRRVVQIAVERCGAERGMLLLGDPPRLAASVGLSRDEEGETLSLSRTVQRKVDEEGALLVSDTRADPLLARSPSVAALRIRSLMGASLRMGSRQLGTLYVDAVGSRALFGEADLRFLRALADQAAVAVAYGQLVGRTARERDAHRAVAAEAFRFGTLVSRSKAMRHVFELLQRVADTDISVIIRGESGTGKELVSRALHFNSRRKDRVFLSENCAALPEGLLESILFGHVRGAFTGADRDRAGLFELAEGGTLLLDEVGEMSHGLQAKLLRVLQEREYRPVGGNAVRKADVRVIAATHQDLAARVRDGAFRQDLYFRLNGMTIEIPPLRERKEDIPHLVAEFLAREATAARRATPRLSAGALRLLMAHSWPGNVRELENVVRRLLLITDGSVIEERVVAIDPEFAHLREGMAGEGRSFVPRAEDPTTERERVREALQRAGGNRDQAAALLGVSRATLYRRMKRFGVKG